MDKHLDAEALSDYAEGLSGAGARAAADAHLASCAQCRRELAAVQAYFRDMADLEPARAPADFLAKVRARLPRPSPWERAWAALLFPFRSIPVPIAVAVILGVTAITVYMRQGGPEKSVQAPAPNAGPASESASGSAESDADRNPPSSPPALKDIGPAEGGSMPSSPPPAPAAPALAPKAVLSGRPSVGPASAPARSKAQAMGRKQAEASQPQPPQANPGDGSGAAATASSVPAAAAPVSPAPTSPAPTSPAPRASSPPASAVLSNAEASPAKPVPAPARPPAAGAPHKLSDVEVEGWLDNPSSVYILDNSQPAQNLPLDKTMPVEDGAAVPGQAEAAAGHAAAKRKAEDGRPQGEPQKKSAPAVLPPSGYALSLRAKSDTAAVLAGLRSMGVEAESEYASPGESRFRLSVPAPMLRELGPYLARHGESHLEGRLPSAASASVLSIRLRLLFPSR